MYWRFAIINNRLGEIYFNKKKNGQVKISGHSYVKREDFHIKEELKALEGDIKKGRVVYRNKKYKLIKV